MATVGTIMRNEFASEALICREQARTFAGRPEEHFLLRVATAFDELATTKPNASRVWNEEVSTS